MNILHTISIGFNVNMNHYNKNVSDNFTIHVFRNVLSESHYIYLI